MVINRRLLTIIGNRRPGAFDAIFPHGPLNHLSKVALNPQPLPPHELGAAVASEFTHAAWLADRFGLDLGATLDALDDLCPPYPKLPKMPPGFPPIPDPDPRPDWLIDYYLGFAARLASVSAGLEGTRLAQSFEKALEQSVASIESAMGDRTK